jgi:hypothetical protein
MATHAAVLLGCGRTAEALASARGAVDRYEVMGAFGARGSFARLVLVEALEAAGETEAARTALAAARDRLVERAAAIADPAVRRTFLNTVPENSRTMALARARLGVAEDELAAPPTLRPNTAPATGPASVRSRKP